MAAHGNTLETCLSLASRKDAIALIDHDLPDNVAGGWTYERLDGDIQTAARLLRQEGVKSGDVVSIAIPNSAEFVVTFLAVAALEAVAAPLNFNYKDSEFEFYLSDSKARYLLVDSSGNPAGEAEAQKAGATILELSLLHKPLSSSDASGDIGEGVALKRKGDGAGKQPTEKSTEKMLPSPSPEACCLLLHTSGTTSRPKAVPLSHSNLCASIRNISKTYSLCTTDVTLLVMPLFHVHGLMCALLATLATGGKVVIPAGGKFSATSFWPTVVKHGVTWYTAVPTIHSILYNRAAADYPRASPPKLRFIRSCSSALSPVLLQKIEAAFSVEVLEAYAMTEASHQMTSNVLGKRLPGSVGAGQNVEVAILDVENKEVPAGIVGEVCIRGPNVTKGYLNNPEANAEAFKGGWFHTGDLGQMDSNGYVTIVGRIKEMINRGGEKISPLEIDEVLMKHPAVAEAVSFACPDEKYGEIVHAGVVLKEGVETDEESLRTHCGRFLSVFKVPAKFHIASVLPKTATGKVQRRLVADHFLKAKQD